MILLYNIRMHKKAIIGGIIVFSAVLAFGLYFFMNGNKLDYLVAQKDKLQNNLAVAEKKLNKEKEKLGTLTQELQASFPLAVSVQAQMRIASDIVKRTDFMFINPYGSNPELIVKNSLKNILINNQRRDINLLLLNWQRKIDLLSVEQINVDESAKIKQDMEMIKSFTDNLSKIVKGLTPENSGLSQIQINTYLSQLNSTGTIDEVLSSVGTAIETYNSNALNTNNGQITSDSGSTVPKVTPNDVITQQSVVAESQNQVTVLQEQLTKVEEQIQPAPPAPVVPAPVVVIPPIENQNTNNTNNPTTPYTREQIKDQGIIVQPGPPRLIQGTDAY